MQWLARRHGIELQLPAVHPFNPLPLLRLLKKGVPRLRVLGHAEIPETQSIRIGRVIGETK